MFGTFSLLILRCGWWKPHPLKRKKKELGLSFEPLLLAYCRDQLLVWIFVYVPAMEPVLFNNSFHMYSIAYWLVCIHNFLYNAVMLVCLHYFFLFALRWSIINTCHTLRLGDVASWSSPFKDYYQLCVSCRRRSVCRDQSVLCVSCRRRSVCRD